jgi:hypothetical protein
MRAALRLGFIVGAAVAVGVSPARAFEEYAGTRAAGMGGATRAWAPGASGALLNPSGMALAKSYDLDGGYAYASRLNSQFLHASVVDSTSELNLAGALYYTYHTSNLGQPAPGHGHEAGAALALPIGDHLALGATFKWFRLAGADSGPGLGTGGATFDVGATIRPASKWSLALVGASLRSLDSAQAPRTLAWGGAFLPKPGLVLALDGIHSFTRDAQNGGRGTGFAVGGEWFVHDTVAVRVGGGYDPMLGVGYVALGAAAVSEVGALDIGVRGDLFPERTGVTRNLFLGASLRLFVPAATSPNP